MNIVFDISHPAHVNFLKKAIYILKERGFNVYITYLNRGKVPRIVEKEFPGFQTKCVGRHKGTVLSIIFEAHILKFFKLFYFLINKKIAIGVSAGSFNLGMVLKILNKPNIQFDDDPERKKNVFLEKLTATELIFPPIVQEGKNVKTMNALKEWAYLSPDYFKPNELALKEYGLIPKQYLFIREVSSGSLNYLGQPEGLVLSFSKMIPNDWTVLLSLEDKRNKKHYPSNWILLEEPVNDIHSLIYYSKLVISSGDSMAREGAMLGVPGIYCGQRDMLANELLMKEGMLFKIIPEEVPDFIGKIEDKKIIYSHQNEFRERLRSEWDNVTNLILELINKYTKER